MIALLQILLIIEAGLIGVKLFDIIVPTRRMRRRRRRQVN